MVGGPSVLETPLEAEAHPLHPSTLQYHHPCHLSRPDNVVVHWTRSSEVEVAWVTNLLLDSMRYGKARSLRDLALQPLELRRMWFLNIQAHTHE